MNGTSRYVPAAGTDGGSLHCLAFLSALLSRGARSVIDAVFDPIGTGELDQARVLARSPKVGMLLPAGRCDGHRTR